MVAGNQVHIGNGSPMIDVQRLTRWFGTTCAVSDFSLQIEAGQVMGFIGPNGAGKTTTMRILATLDEPDVRDAFVDGFSVVNDPDRVRSRLGFMPDTYGTYPNVNTLEYLDFFARAYGLMGSARVAAIRRVLDFTHMQHMAEKPINGLSKGMKQRLCLGRALIHDPQVMVLDEPAAGLDPRARIELKEMIASLAAQGKSLLISSHILTELAEMCDEVAIIERGVLLAKGTIDQILHGGSAADSRDETKHVWMQVDYLDSTQVVDHWLAAHPLIKDAQVNGKTAEFRFPNVEQARADLLAEMIQAGLRITRFAVKQRSLEDAFLQVTKGNVQ